MKEVKRREGWVVAHVAKPLTTWVVAQFAKPLTTKGTKDHEGKTRDVGVSVDYSPPVQHGGLLSYKRNV